MNIKLRLEQPPFEGVNANMANQQDRYISMYVIAVIEGIPCKMTIPDTGASMSIMSKAILHKLGWNITKPPKTSVESSGGQTWVPLEIVKDVLVQFGAQIIPIDMAITENTSYDLLLGNDWLEKAQAVINIPKQQMKFSWRGNTFVISAVTAKLEMM